MQWNQRKNRMNGYYFQMTDNELDPNKDRSCPTTQIVLEEQILFFFQSFYILLKMLKIILRVFINIFGS